MPYLQFLVYAYFYDGSRANARAVGYLGTHTFSQLCKSIENETGRSVLLGVARHHENGAVVAIFWRTSRGAINSLATELGKALAAAGQISKFPSEPEPEDCGGSD